MLRLNNFLVKLKKKLLAINSKYIKIPKYILYSNIIIRINKILKIPI